MRALWLLLPVLTCLTACGRDRAGVDTEPVLVGVWVLDVQAFRASFVRMTEEEIERNARRGTLPPAEADLMRTQLLQEVHDKFSSMWARFTFREDGTFGSEGSDGVLSGRWGLHGRRLSLTVTEEKGVAKEQPDVWPGTVEDGAIRLRPQADKDYEITLRRE